MTRLGSGLLHAPRLRIAYMGDLVLRRRTSSISKFELWSSPATAFGTDLQPTAHCAGPGIVMRTEPSDRSESSQTTAESWQYIP